MDFIDDLAEINSSQTRELNKLKSSSSVNQSNINNNNNLINQWRNEARQSITANRNNLSSISATISDNRNNLSLIRTDINTNISNIRDNTNNINTIQGNISGVTDNLAALTNNVNTNTNNISTNTNNISTNTNNISTNNDSIRGPLANAIQNVAEVVRENRNILNQNSFINTLHSIDDLEKLDNFEPIPSEYTGNYKSMNNNLSGITEDALVMHENSMVFGGEITDFRTLETSLPYDASDNINLLRQQFPKYTSEHLDFIKSKMNEKNLYLD